MTNRQFANVTSVPLMSVPLIAPSRAPSTWSLYAVASSSAVVARKDQFSETRMHFRSTSAESELEGTRRRWDGADLRDEFFWTYRLKGKKVARTNSRVVPIFGFAIPSSLASTSHSAHLVDLT